MNSIFRPFLRNFVLVFFDDILIYRKSWEKHVQHVNTILDKHQLYFKPLNYYFGVHEVEYLGHIVSQEGVKVDPYKMQAMVEWEAPRNLKHLRGFLGITGYYHIFVKKNSGIAAPLTIFLKKYSFQWNDEVYIAFEQLKVEMCTTLVMETLDFSKTFIF